MLPKKDSEKEGYIHSVGDAECEVMKCSKGMSQNLAQKNKELTANG
jgi:hypothetical protein